MGVADSTRDKKMDSPGKQMPGSSIDTQTARQLAEMAKQLKRERGVEEEKEEEKWDERGNSRWRWRDGRRQQRELGDRRQARETTGDS